MPNLRAAARTLGVQFQILNASSPGELDDVLRALQQKPPEALLVAPVAFYLSYGTSIAEAARRSRIATMGGYRDFVTDGGMASYGPDLKRIGSLMAEYVGKILKGANPAELPIEQVSTYELVITAAWHTSSESTCLRRFCSEPTR